MNVKLIAVGSRPWEHRLGYWGLSYVIDGTILYDTFSNYSVLARKLGKAGVDPTAIQSVVLSHEHPDHIGGLWTFLEKRPGIDVYLPSTANEAVKRRVVLSGGHLVAEPGVKILKENIWLSNDRCATHKEKSVGEHSILLKAGKGFVVLVGCSHPGIVSIVKETKEYFGSPVYGIAGGLHLMHADTDAIRACANDLKNEGVQLVAPTHCTGWRAERIFRNVFGKGYVPSREGKTLTL